MDALQLAKTFVRTVVRMFYETEHIVLIDALVFHGALTTGDMVIVLDWSKNSKGAGKVVGILKEAGLVSVFTRQELREGAMKAMNREYFYIDYRRAIDATKYKIHLLDEHIKANAAPTQEKKELQCKVCKAQWTHMEVLDNVDPLGRESGFLCKQCNNPLFEITGAADALDSDDAPAKFNKFFGPLLKLMQQIDDVTIPLTEGQAAVDNMIELPRDKDTNPGARHIAVEDVVSKPTEVKGIASRAPDKVEVEIKTDSEYTEAARAAEAERQAKISMQNQLPDWHTKSTVDKSAIATPVKYETNGVSIPTIKTEAGEEKNGRESNLDDVFARLEAEQRKAEDEESEEEDDDDEDDFEDVPAIQPEAKRIKMDSSAAPSPAAGATPTVSTGDANDESDEDDFVDV